jgi:hypothetical protein
VTSTRCGGSPRSPRTASSSKCTYSRFPLDAKLLKLIRITDPLRHQVENLSAVTEREAKILHLIALADEHGLPADAGRRDLQDFAKLHNARARAEVFNEVARRRKTAAEGPENRSRPSGTKAPAEPPKKALSRPEPAGTRPPIQPILNVNCWFPSRGNQREPASAGTWFRSPRL